jgi:putative PIN family toxin of toxin-antitoxin system
MRLVLDSNVWLDLLVFEDPSVAPLREALKSGRAQVFVDARAMDELRRVLVYDLGRWSMDEARQAECMGQAARLAQVIEVEPAGAALPRCSDPDDQKFLELALAAKADALLTKDQALLDLARRKSRPAPFKIITPKDLVLAP